MSGFCRTLNSTYKVLKHDLAEAVGMTNRAFELYL